VHSAQDDPCTVPRMTRAVCTCKPPSAARATYPVECKPQFLGVLHKGPVKHASVQMHCPLEHLGEGGPAAWGNHVGSTRGYCPGIMEEGEGGLCTYPEECGPQFRGMEQLAPVKHASVHTQLPLKHLRGWKHKDNPNT
jgi:hypothetical protein